MRLRDILRSTALKSDNGSWEAAIPAMRCLPRVLSPCLPSIPVSPLARPDRSAYKVWE